ncbi:hypothetical protein [Paenibacillus sp. NPDC057934]|uniref:hypothetical protein n=1 Tax=Paenibacillus sp. NPDC057934 TaxID=3346282 RepID=UPI0036D96619
MEGDKMNIFFNKITPTDTQKEKMLNHILNANCRTSNTHLKPKGKEMGLRWIVAASILAVLLSIGTLLYPVNQPKFSMIAYAADVNNDVTTNSIVVEISGKTGVKLPFGTIKREGDPVETTDEQGNKVWRYNTNYINSDSRNAISVKGEDIVAVTYRSERGQLNYTDYLMMKQDKDYLEEEQKAKEKGENLVFLNMNNAPYYQYGKMVTPKYYAQLGDRSFAVNWVPLYALDILSADGNITNIPHEKITISVTFTNGAKLTKYIDLSFNKTGEVIAKIIN